MTITIYIEKRTKNVFSQSIIFSNNTFKKTYLLPKAPFYDHAMDNFYYVYVLKEAVYDYYNQKIKRETAKS